MEDTRNKKETISKHYLKGFNDAAVLMEYKPSLLSLLICKTDNDYFRGIADGYTTFFASTALYNKPKHKK